jgi:hemerythrin
MPIEWTPDMSVGVDEIDDQHKELLKRTDGLISAIKASKSINDIERIVASIQNYIVSHFETEEKYMVRYGYHQYISHKAQHTLYVMELSGIKRSLLYADTDTSITQAQNRIVDWLICHIDQEDKALGSFINSARLKKAA